MPEEYFETLPNEEQMFSDDEDFLPVRIMRTFDVVATPEKIRSQIQNGCPTPSF